MQSKPSLFERLGGSSGIARIVDDVVSRHRENPAIRARFMPYFEDPEHVRALKVHLVHFFEAGSGGPQRYTGRDMRSAHRGMNISPGEYMAALDDILGALGATGTDDETQRDVLAIAWSLKGDIIQV